MTDREVNPQSSFLLKRVELERESFKVEREKYENEIVNNASEMRKLKSELHAARVRSNDLELSLGDIHKLKAIAAEYDALGGVSLLDRFQELVTKCRSLEVDNGILQAFRHKDEERIVQLDAHNKELVRKLSNMEDYHEIKRDLTAANAKLLQLTGDSSSHDAVVTGLHEDYLRLQREYSSLQFELMMERKKTERLSVTVEVLELDVKRSDQSINSLAPDFEILKFEAEGYKQKAAEAVVRADNELWLHQETRSQLERLESTCKQLEVQTGLLALQCETLQESLDKVVAENKNLKDVQASRTRALESLADEREKLMLELADIYAIGSAQEVIQKAQQTTALQLELSNLRSAFQGQCLMCKSGFCVNFLLHSSVLSCAASELESEHEDARRKIMEDAQIRFQVGAPS
jgi:hypothetical protein